MMQKSPLLVKSERDEANHSSPSFQGIQRKKLSQPAKYSLLEKYFMIISNASEVASS